MLLAYETGVVTRPYPQQIGAADGNRTRLNLIDNQVPYPEDYNGKLVKEYTALN